MPIRKTVVLSLVLIALSAIQSGLASDQPRTWTAHLEFDPEIRVGFHQNQSCSISPLGVKIIGVDLGGCPKLEDFMVDAVLHEIREGIVGPGFEIQTAEVHCRAQCNDTKFLLVLLGSGYSPYKNISGHGYVMSGTGIESLASPVMSMTESYWGAHAVQFLVENGKVVRVAIVHQDRLSNSLLSLLAMNGQKISSRNIRRFYLTENGDRVYAISVSEVPCIDRDMCPKWSKLLAVVEHSASDKILDSRVLNLGAQDSEEKALYGPLTEEFEELTQRTDPVPLKWIYP